MDSGFLQAFQRHPPRSQNPSRRVPQALVKSPFPIFEHWPNRAPTELPQTSAWPCRKMCCVGFSWCLRPQSVGCWHKHRPNRTYCLKILAPEHAAPSRPETCTLVPRGSVQQFFLRMLQAKRLTFPQVLALLRFIFINHWSGAQKWTGPRLSKDFKRRLYYWVKEEWITIIL